MKIELDIEQGGELWHKIRAFLVTGSVAKTLMVNGKNEYGLGAGALTKAYEKLAYIKTGMRDSVKTNSMEHGHTWEPFARREYMRTRFQNVRETGIVIKKGIGGYSPDGLLELENGGVEFKCPSSNKVFYMVANGLQDPLKDYKEQCLFGNMVADLDFMDLTHYSPYFPDGENLLIQRVQKDEEWQEKMEEKCQSFYRFMSEKLGEDSWVMLNRLLKKQGLQIIE